MKWHKIGLVIFFMLAMCFQAACSSGNTSNPLSCSQGSEVCINTSAGQPTGNPVTLIILVTSSKDIPDLNVSLRIPVGATIDGPQTWENYIVSPSVDQWTAYWDFAIHANQTLTFNRVLHFPSGTGAYQIFVEANTKNRIIHAVDEFDIQITNNGSYLIRAGTPYLSYTRRTTNIIYGPGTPVPPTYGLGPLVATSTPSRTRTRTPIPYPPPSTPITPPAYP